MKRVDDKECNIYGSSAEDNPSSNSTSFLLHKGSSSGSGSNEGSHHHKVLSSRSKPTPSKWDDAQKWLAGLSGSSGHGNSKSKPRNSNADDRRLLNSASQKVRDSCSSAEGLLEDYAALVIALRAEGEDETKKMDCNEPLWRIIKPEGDSPLAVRSVCLRDMGTEMTPIASQEPSRTATPIRATTPVLRSPMSSRSSTPGRRREGDELYENYQTSVKNLEHKSDAVLFRNGRLARVEGELQGFKILENGGLEQVKMCNSLESRAMAWDEAERAKYMARYKHEEVRIKAWENHEKRKAEMEMKRIEVKAERLKSRAQERLVSKLASTLRISEEKRANAEAKLNEKAARTSERADYIRRTGRLPSSFFSLKVPSFCS